MASKKRPPALATTAASSFGKSSAISALEAVQLTDEQLGQIKEAFDLFDSETSGYIAANELEFALSALGLECSKEELRDLQRQFSMSSHDHVSLEVFTGMAKARLSARDMEQEMVKAFKLFDADGSGAITVKALKKVALELGEDVTDAFLEEMIAEADSNHDGVVTQDEFVKIMKRTAMC